MYKTKSSGQEEELKQMAARFDLQVVQKLREDIQRISSQISH